MIFFRYMIHRQYTTTGQKATNGREAGDLNVSRGLIELGDIKAKKGISRKKTKSKSEPNN
jgi:hypothetical protein